ncbi:MAG: protein-disulfide reductase DsbD domain-containing protein [Verrucomicrobiota bacterium]
MGLLRNFLLPSLLVAAGVLSADAQPVRAEHASLELISETDAVVPGEVFNLAVQFTIDPHWHIYWKNPGSSGLPPEITWELPDGFIPGDIQWPAPKRIELGGLINYGYEDVVSFIIPVRASEILDESSVLIRADLFYLICEEVCLPGEASLELSLPVAGSSKQSAEAGVFDTTRRSHPLADVPFRLTSSTEGDQWILQLEADEETPIPSDLYFYAAAEGVLDPDAPQTLSFLGPTKARLSAGLAATFSADSIEKVEGVLQSNETSWLVSPPLTETIPDAEPELKGVAAFQSDPAESSGGFEDRLLSLGLPGWLTLAFLGGLILNVMPCVLPVLSLKVFSLLKHTGQSRKESIMHGGAYSVGVIASFLILAAALLGLRSLGEQIGWGFQLQSPGFIVLLSTVFFLFGLNLMGVFEIGASLVGADSGMAQRTDLLGSFGMGILAAVVGAPCMGPMVASVSGIAIQANALTGLLIFGVMGAGLASPFMLLAVFPKLVAYLPKPGLWMESVKQFMGFLLMAAVVFLLWVVGGQGGSDAIMAIVTVLLIVAVAAWIYGRWAAPVRSRKSQWFARILALVLIIGSGAYGLGKAEAAFATYAERSEAEDGGQWGAWSREAVDEALAQGKPVFIDFTASWCLICQVNKKVALRTEATTSLFEEYDVVALEADWTRRDQAIAKELESFGRAGVPLYVLYHPDGGTSVLPQSLTNGIIRDAFENVFN